MIYTLTIRKTEENPNYDAQMKEWNEDSRYTKNRFNSEIPPNRDVTTNVLMVSLTEEQFEALKIESIKVFS